MIETEEKDYKSNVRSFQKEGYSYVYNIRVKDEKLE